MKKRLACFLLVLYLVLAAVAWAQPQIPPAPTTSIYVQDYAGVLTTDTKQRINSLSSQLAARTKAQVVVVTVKSLNGAVIEDYALGILRQWGVGDKQLNNGVVLVVSVGDRQSRVEVGYGLEGALPDAKTGRIQDEYMIPWFQQSDFDRGILNGYLALAGEVAREYKLELPADTKPVPKTRAPAQESSWFDALPWWGQALLAAGVIALFLFDWFVLGGTITYLLLSLLRNRGGGGGGGSGGGWGGGSGGGGGSSRKW